MKEPEEDKEMELLTQHCSQLREWFDSVIILATRADDDGEDTTIWTKGLGNQFASLGAAHRYISEAEASAASSVLEIQIEDPDEPDE